VAGQPFVNVRLAVLGVLRLIDADDVEGALDVPLGRRHRLKHRLEAERFGCRVGAVRVVFGPFVVGVVFPADGVGVEEGVAVQRPSIRIARESDSTRPMTASAIAGLLSIPSTASL
jgi:hypothetical protein